LATRQPTTYAEQTHHSPFWIVRWPHRQRIRHAAKTIQKQHPTTVLDYGAGDGAVLEAAIALGVPASGMVAHEPSPKFAALFRERLGAVPVVMEREDVRGPFDVVCCLGVLEHMPLLERVAFYELCERVLAPQGSIIVDVPVEVGPALAVKAFGRIVLKGRTREYSNADLFRHVFGAIQFDPARFDPTSHDTWIHHHQGFDYRLLEQEMRSRFVLTDKTCTPVPALPAGLNQEVLTTWRRGTDGGDVPASITASAGKLPK
jgi:SAM-dependent methyltransferase